MTLNAMLSLMLVYKNLLTPFQSFLGMVQLEYQARVDMVQLIDLLEKACIRFAWFYLVYN